MGSRRAQCSALGYIEVSVDAYGSTGPWSGRRSFDGLAQISCGIADAGMRWAGATQPRPLPFQGLGLFDVDRSSQRWRMPKRYHTDCSRYNAKAEFREWMKAPRTFHARRERPWAVRGERTLRHR